MSFSSVTDWDNEYARLQRVASQMRTQGHSTSAAEADALRQGLTRLNNSLDGLGLSASEVTRRRRLVQHLLGNGNAAAIQQQDDMIDELAVGVGRLKQQSHMIGEEARLHLGLLGDMEEQADRAQTGLAEETRHAETIRDNQSVWRLQLTICVLFTLLIVLVLKGVF
eukprot:CAMPEP_0116835542 /NCGR_PEP_ID=MMETSP0418-20121206/7603_1 /TAXON_ID=1158023 /ORGANISM="Astrosyne radiata, Strain 13vi08-1A" /LENGTH=166 /DNA_ID=CAMNT_0004465221 /DNA_START=89 /DNA_END=589 /DNA_ORIENTATION=-